MDKDLQQTRLLFLCSVVYAKRRMKTSITTAVQLFELNDSGEKQHEIY
jgi:hypothetical protein